MKKFTLNCRTTWFHCWFLAIACQSGYGLSQEHFNYEEYPLPGTSWHDSRPIQQDRVESFYPEQPYDLPYGQADSSWHTHTSSYQNIEYTTDSPFNTDTSSHLPSSEQWFQVPLCQPQWETSQTDHSTFLPYNSQVMPLYNQPEYESLNRPHCDQSEFHPHIPMSGENVYHQQPRLPSDEGPSHSVNYSTYDYGQSESIDSRHDYYQTFNQSQFYQPATSPTSSTSQWPEQFNTQAEQTTPYENQWREPSYVNDYQFQHDITPPSSSSQDLPNFDPLNKERSPLPTHDEEYSHPNSSSEDNDSLQEEPSQKYFSLTAEDDRFHSSSSFNEQESVYDSSSSDQYFESQSPSYHQIDKAEHSPASVSKETSNTEHQLPSIIKPQPLEPHYPEHSAFNPSSDTNQTDANLKDQDSQENESKIESLKEKEEQHFSQKDEKQTTSINFTEAKSTTKLIKKSALHPTFDETIGSQTFFTPTIGASSSHLAENEQSKEKSQPTSQSQAPSQSPTKQTSTPSSYGSSDPATSAFPTPNSKVVQSQSNQARPSNKTAHEKETLAQIDHSSTDPLLDPLDPPIDPVDPSTEQDPLAPSDNTQLTPIDETTPQSESPLLPDPSTSTVTTPSEETPTLPPATPPTAPATPPAPTAPAPTTPELPAASTRIITPSSDATTIETQPTIPADEPTILNGSPGESLGVTPQPIREISINFNNVAMVEFIRFISRISNKNFIFDEQDLLFNVTIVSEEPTSIENLMSALLQELRIRDLSLIEQGNNIIIHRNPRVRAPARIVAEGVSFGQSRETELVTQVFRLNTLDPNRAAEIIRPLLSDDALVEILRDSNNLIITDLMSNVNKIAQLISSLDAPNSGMIIGQYAVRNAFVESLTALAERILLPIAQGNPFVLIPHPATNSIFVVSNPFIVERALAILENLDMNEGRTKIFTLEKLRLSDQELRARQEAERLRGTDGTRPGLETRSVEEPLLGVPVGPGGQPLPSAGIGTEGALTPATFPMPPQLMPGGISSNPRWIQELPPGHIERTLFFIYKLKYRRGDQLEIALRRIADSLLMTGLTNEDLIAAINSIQFIESSNSLIFTGTALALDRIRELIEEIDVPLRQVFIEMLILDTTITDSLNYGVDWGTRFGGGNTAGGQAFLGGGAGSLLAALDSASTNSPTNFPDPTPLNRSIGYSLGVVGRHLTHDGMLFNSIAALVQAIHDDAKANIILNPKIITEDNNTAEIFVGSTDRFKTQSISNDLGNVITNNFQFIDVGTTLRVTPLIGNNDIITLDIVEEITNDAAGANPVGTSAADVDVNLIPVLSKSRTLTRVHVPNGFFVVLSGMIQDNRSRTNSRIPCLGGIPILGASSKQKRNRDSKRNLMIFIRPVIVDTEEELENITKRQQDVYREKSKFRRSWNYEIDEALDFLNIRRTDPDEIGCTVK